MEIKNEKNDSEDYVVLSFYWKDEISKSGNLEFLF